VTPVKRGTDLAVAALLAVPAMVVLGVCIIAGRASGTRDSFIRSRRAGLDGRPFDVWKLGTTTSDGRATRVGAVLRRTGLDELPQLWNVIRGEMSVVGPRPLTTEFVDRYSTEQRRRLAVKPGLTGWAQVAGRHARTWPESFAFDVWYVEHRSVRLDLKIMLLTIVSLARRHRDDVVDHANFPEFT